MKYTLLTIALFSLPALTQAQPTAEEIIQKVDNNLSSDNRIMETAITIHGRRSSRTLTAKTYAVGTQQSFTEYLSPARDRGTKMLKLEDQLWIYSPSTDRTIQIAGHMLRQSVMGSDLSYEDMMDDRPLNETYEATILGKERLDDRDVYLLELKAKVSDVAYHSSKMWVDVERFIPLKQEMHAKSGQLLKRIELRDVEKTEGRWFPRTMVYKDLLKDGKGTEYKITDIQFNAEIPEYIFSKAALKR
jgi:outer membrane lipoprotein-sorting protein